MSEVDHHEPATTVAGPPVETIERALRAAVDSFGPGSFADAAVLRTFLLRRCPDAEPDVGLLLVGLEEEVPQALLGLRAVESLDLLGQVLQQRLSNRRSLNSYAAAWVVKTWSDALRLREEPSGRAPMIQARADAASAPVPDVAPKGRPAANRPLSSATPTTGPGRWIPIGIAIAAMIVISFAILYEARRSPSQSSTAAPEDTLPGSPRREMQSLAAAMDGQPSTEPVEIVDVGSSEQLVGDGKQHTLYAALSGPRDDVASIESRFVGGDGALWSRPTVLDLSKGSIADERVPAGTIGSRTTRELKATFEFVVVTRDGRRSAPFSKQLTVSPVAATPPSITDVSVPAPVVSGRPFDVTIAIRDDDGRLAAIERAVVGDDGQPRVRMIPASAVKRTNNAVTLPINASWNGPWATIELTLLDKAGARSETKRVVFDVLQPNAAVAAAPVEARGTPAHGPAPACTRKTCGSVVAVREMDAGASVAAPRSALASRPSYEIIVRTDDRAIHTFRQPMQIRTGARARLVDGRLLVMNTGEPTVSRPIRREGRLVPESEPIFSP